MARMDMGGSMKRGITAGRVRAPKEVPIKMQPRELVPIAKRPVWNQTKDRAWQAVFAKIDTGRQYK